MTIEELKEYYDAGGRQRLSALDEKGKRDLFKRFTVSLINQNLILTFNRYRNKKRRRERPKNAKIESKQARNCYQRHN